MNYQKSALPPDAKYAASTPEFNEKNVPHPILGKHLAPRGKFGLLVVTSGTLQLVWEDTGEIVDADSDHPVVIYPERFHHVSVTGPVEFHIEFYQVKSASAETAATAGTVRPGEKFL